MRRLKHYWTGLKNLGFVSLLRFEYQFRSRHYGPIQLTSKRLDFPVHVRPQSSDMEVFSQIFFFHEYRCVPSQPAPKLVIDLGANVGYSSAYFLSRFKNCLVISVEPDPANFVQLQKNVAPYGSRVKTIQAAVWPRNERLDLTHAGPGEEWGVRVKLSKFGAVQTVTIPELLQSSGQERVSLLKVDIEGAETQLFSSGAEEWLDRVDNIIIELHGKDAMGAFFKAIDKSRFSISTCDELTVCLS
jgi:FkbM family methyltransferase